MGIRQKIGRGLISKNLSSGSVFYRRLKTTDIKYIRKKQIEQNTCVDLKC